jgi:hypothetical protein
MSDRPILDDDILKPTTAEPDETVEMPTSPLPGEDEDDDQGDGTEDGKDKSPLNPAPEE